MFFYKKMKDHHSSILDKKDYIRKKTNLKRWTCKIQIWKEKNFEICDIL